MFCNISAFRQLLDNYETETGVKEVVTDEEESENLDFINEIMKTPVIQKLHHFLVSEDKANKNVDQFKQQLYDLWFKLYKRRIRER